MLSPELSQFLEQCQQGFDPNAPVTIDLLRLTLDQMASDLPFSAKAQVSPVDTGGVPSVLLSFPEAAEGRTVLYLHGGGYIAGSFTSHRALAAGVAQAAKATVLFPEYRLAPDHPFPAGLEDAVTAYRWLVEDQGLAPSSISIVGDSAGGGLAMATLFTLRDRGLPMPAAAAVMSPWTDLPGRGKSHTERVADDPFLTVDALEGFAQMYTAGLDRMNPLLSPLYGDFEGLPPLLIQVGSREILFDDSAEMAVKARQAGVDATLDVGEGLFHVYQYVSHAPESLQALKRLGDFLKSHSPAQLTVWR